MSLFPVTSAPPESTSPLSLKPLTNIFFLEGGRCPTAQELAPFRRNLFERLLLFSFMFVRFQSRRPACLIWMVTFIVVFMPQKVCADPFFLLSTPWERLRSTVGPDDARAWFATAPFTAICGFDKILSPFSLVPSSLRGSPPAPTSPFSPTETQMTFNVPRVQASYRGCWAERRVCSH